MNTTEESENLVNYLISLGYIDIDEYVTEILKED
jgi:hypothetical protein